MRRLNNWEGDGARVADGFCRMTWRPGAAIDLPNLRCISIASNIPLYLSNLTLLHSTKPESLISYYYLHYAFTSIFKLQLFSKTCNVNLNNRSNIYDHIECLLHVNYHLYQCEWKREIQIYVWDRRRSSTYVLACGGRLRVAYQTILNVVIHCLLVENDVCKLYSHGQCMAFVTGKHFIVQVV